MQSPAFSETIGSGLSVQTEKLGEDQWKAHVPSQPTLRPATAPTEQQALEQLNRNIAGWLGGKRA